jgi:prevent-host-death family protein
MRIAPLSEVKARLSAYVEQCEKDGPVVITRNGRAVAVLLSPVDDDDLERLILARSRRLQRLLARSRQTLRAGDGLAQKEFWEVVAERHRKKRNAQ